MNLFRFDLYLLALLLVNFRHSVAYDEEDSDNDDSQERQQTSVPVVQIFQSIPVPMCDPSYGPCPPASNLNINQPSYLPYSADSGLKTMRKYGNTVKRVPCDNPSGCLVSVRRPSTARSGGIDFQNALFPQNQPLYVEGVDMTDKESLKNEIQIAKKYIKEFQEYLKTHPLVVKQKAGKAEDSVSEKSLAESKKVSDTITDRAEKALDGIEKMLSKSKGSLEDAKKPEVTTTASTTTTTTTVAPKAQKSKKRKASKKKKSQKKKKRDEEEEEEEEEGEEELGFRQDSPYYEYPYQAAYRDDMYQPYYQYY